MNDELVDATLVQMRHRDAVRILVASAVVGLPLLVTVVIGVEWGSFWDQVLAGVLGFAVFAAATAALHLRRNRERYALAVQLTSEVE